MPRPPRNAKAGNTFQSFNLDEADARVSFIEGRLPSFLPFCEDIIRCRTRNSKGDLIMPIAIQSLAEIQSHVADAVLKVDANGKYTPTIDMSLAIGDDYGELADDSSIQPAMDNFVRNQPSSHIIFNQPF